MDNRHLIDTPNTVHSFRTVAHLFSTVPQNFIGCLYTVNSYLSPSVPVSDPHARSEARRVPGTHHFYSTRFLHAAGVRRRRGHPVIIGHH
jgi:hypothetical protein